jgi:hypothetical protein
MSLPQYFAEIDNNNLVINIHVVTQKFLDENPDRYPGMYVETFVDVPGKTYAGIGYTYNRVTDDFVPPIYNFQPISTK